MVGDNVFLSLNIWSLRLIHVERKACETAQSSVMCIWKEWYDSFDSRVCA
jgi:hypothetical protein